MIKDRCQDKPLMCQTIIVSLTTTSTSIIIFIIIITTRQRKSDLSSLDFYILYDLDLRRNF